MTTTKHCPHATDRSTSHMALVRTALASFALALAVAAPAAAQGTPDANESKPIEAFARRAGDSVVIRWTPMSPELWRAGLKQGYRVRRSDGVESTVRVWDEARWRALARVERERAATVVGILYDSGMTANRGANDGRFSGGEFAFDGDIEEMRYGTSLLLAAVDPTVGDGLALRFVDRSAAPGRAYEYCVSIAGVAAATGCVTVGAEATPPVPMPDSLIVRQRGDSVDLYWSMAKYDDLLGFTIVRTDEETRQSVALTNGPLLMPILPDSVERRRVGFTDVTAKIGRRYRYEIRATDGFAEVSAPLTATAANTPLQPLPAAPAPETVQRDACAVEISWSLPADAPEGLCARLERSNSPSENFETLATSCSDTKLLYIDTAAGRQHPYYRVVLTDDKGRTAMSAPTHVLFTDSTDPATPAMLRGEIDAAGAVLLRWQPVVECDLAGYRVYWSNDPTHEFMPRMKAVHAETSFRDTVNIETLTRRVYYRVAAVDRYGNRSAFSPVFALERPDLIRPLPPVPLDASPVDSAIVVRWQRSPSADVAKQHLIRTAGADTAGTTIAVLESSVTQYRDASVQRGVDYTYRIVVEDSSGNRSSVAGPVRARLEVERAAPEVLRLNAMLDAAQRSVRLNWEVTQPLEAGSWFVVHRGLPGGDLTALGTVESTARTYADTKLVGPGEYTYAVQIVGPSGRSTLVRATIAVPANVLEGPRR